MSRMGKGKKKGGQSILKRFTADDYRKNNEESSSR